MGIVKGVIFGLFRCLFAVVRVSCGGRRDYPYTPQGDTRTTSTRYSDNCKALSGRPQDADKAWVCYRETMTLSVTDFAKHLTTYPKSLEILLPKGSLGS